MNALQFFLKGKDIIHGGIIQNIYIREKINWKKFLYRINGPIEPITLTGQIH